MTTPPDATSTNGHGHILNSLLLFGEVLRKAGLDVGSGNMLDMVRAMDHVPFGRKQDFRQAARCILVHRKQDLPLFDEAFEVFWRTPATRQITRDIKSLGEERRYRKPEVGPPPPGSELGSTDKGDGEAQPGDSIDLTQTYNAREVLRAKDFADFSPWEIADARRMMAELYWDLGTRRTRRLSPGGSASLDLRRTLRRNVKYGGELVELAGQSRKNKPRPLVLICDVSGSMERYTRMLLHFIHSIARNSATGTNKGGVRGMGNAQQIEAFLFATRLTRVTRFLNHRSIDQAVTEVSRAVPDWAGGTRIGQAVKTFNFQWLRRVGTGGPVVLVISDGWDRGEPEVLGREMSRLQRSCHRLIWLNPLLGSPDYEPLTRGIQAALPYVDDFLPVHNLNSLEALAEHLNNLSTERQPVRAYRTPMSDESAPETPPVEYREIDPDTAPTFRHPMWGRRR